MKLSAMVIARISHSAFSVIQNIISHHHLSALSPHNCFSTNLQVCKKDYKPKVFTPVCGGKRESLPFKAILQYIQIKFNKINMAKALIT